MGMAWIRLEPYWLKMDTSTTSRLISPSVNCASEWLCTKIGEEIGIAAPTPQLIEMLDKRLLFGSRRIAGTGNAVADFADSNNSDSC